MSAMVLITMMPVTFVSAAGIETKIAKLYEDSSSYDESASGGDSTSYQGYNYNIWQWQNPFGDRAVSKGGHAGDKALVIGFNNASTGDDSNIHTDAPTFAGLIWRKLSNWSNYTKDLSSYAETGYVVANLNIPNAEYLDHMYLTLGDTADGTTYVGINIADQYTPEDVGKWKKVAYPLSAFVNGSKDYKVYQFNTKGGTNYLNLSKHSQWGLMFDPCNITTYGEVLLDEMYICNVEAPTRLTIKEASATTAKISWNPTMSDVIGYEILRNGEHAGAVTADKTEFVDENLTEGTEYDYTVRALDKYGAYSIESNMVRVYTSAVGSPDFVKAKSSFSSELKVELTWGEPIYGEEHITGYNVYRGRELIGTVDADARSYTDYDVINNKFYNYHIKSVSSGGTESMASEVATILACYLGYPAEITAEVNDRDVIFEWSAVNSAVGYQIFCNGKLIADVADTTYVHENNDYNTANTYEIISYDALGTESLPSDKILKLIADPTSVDEVVMFDEIFVSPHTAGVIGTQGSTSEIVVGDAATGEQAVELYFAPSSSVDEGFKVAFPEANYSDLRVNGGAVEFYAFIEEKSDIKDMVVALEIESSAQNALTSAYTKVKLENYVDIFGYWTYVRIPLSDFGYLGYYQHKTNGNLPEKFRFNQVKGLAIFLDEAIYENDRVIRVDEIKLTKKSQSSVSAVKNNKDEVIYSAYDNIFDATVTRATQNIDIEMATGAFVTSTITEDTVKVISSADGSEVEINPTVDGSVIKIEVKENLAKSTYYNIVIDGVEDMAGTIYNDVVIGFVTNSDKGTAGGGGSAGGGAGGSSVGFGGNSDLTADEVGGGRDEAVPFEEMNPELSDKTAGGYVSNSGLIDADELEWAAEAIDYLFENGYVTGYDDNTFRPNNSVTREEFITMLVKMLKIKPLDSGCTFTDVQFGDWYYGYVAAAEVDGIVEGFDGKFGVGDTISRQDMCVMVARAAQKHNISLKNNFDKITFADTDLISDYAEESVEKLQRAGIVNGVGNDCFDPEGQVNRAMAAKIIYEVLMEM